MKTNAKLCAAAVLSAGLIAAAHAAPAQPASATRITDRAAVNYVCKKGGSLNVKYAFNRPGIPVNATLKIGGVTRVLKYDMNLSNNMDTYFQDSRGNKLGMESMERGNLRRAAIITVVDSRDRIMYRDCTPRR